MAKKKQYETVTVESLGNTIAELETLYRDVYKKKEHTAYMNKRWEERVHRSTSISENGWKGTAGSSEVFVPEANRTYFKELLEIAIKHRDGTSEQVELMTVAIKTILDRIEELKKVTKNLELHESMSKNLQALKGEPMEDVFMQNIVDLLVSTRSIKYQAEALMELRMDTETKPKGEISGK